MEQHGAGLMLQDAALILGFALAAVLLFRRLGLGATLGYLVAGALIGPHVLGLVGNAAEMATVAELGIVLLLFVVGLELSPAAAVADEGGDLRAGAGAGAGLRAGGDRHGAGADRLHHRRRARHRPAAGAVLHRAGAADAAIGGPFAHPLW